MRECVDTDLKEKEGEDRGLLREFFDFFYGMDRLDGPSRRGRNTFDGVGRVEIVSS